MACAYQIELPSRINPPQLIPYTHRRTLFILCVGRLGGGVAYPPVTWVTGMSRCGSARRVPQRSEERVKIIYILVLDQVYIRLYWVYPRSLALPRKPAAARKREIAYPPHQTVRRRPPSAISRQTALLTGRVSTRCCRCPSALMLGLDSVVVGVTPDSCVSWGGGCAVCAFCSRPEVTMPACAVCARANAS